MVVGTGKYESGKVSLTSQRWLLNQASSKATNLDLGMWDGGVVESDGKRKKQLT